MTASCLLLAIAAAAFVAGAAIAGACLYLLRQPVRPRGWDDGFPRKGSNPGPPGGGARPHRFTPPPPLRTDPVENSDL